MAIEKIKILGKGNYGTVYLVRNKKTNNLYALKKNLCRKTYFNEINLLRKINHKNIIKIFHNYQKNNYCNIILEYVDDGTLEDKINNNINTVRHFTYDEIKNYILQISNGLRYIHLHKIIHRDIKPSNILINTNNIIKISDFGISKDILKKKYCESFVGTPYYLAPELVNGDKYSFEVDYWALGCILYELICLKRPFEGKSLYSLVLKINKCDYNKKILPIKYHNIITYLLHKDPLLRYNYLQINKFFSIILLPKINITFTKKQNKEKSILDLYNKYKSNNITRS